MILKKFGLDKGVKPPMEKDSLGALEDASKQGRMIEEIDQNAKPISDLKLPKTVKEIQSHNEKLVALSRFLSKGADKALPFLKVLNNCTNKKWRIDIVGPLLMAPGGARFLVVAIGYFTKLVEAKPLVSTTRKHMEKFVEVPTTILLRAWSEDWKRLTKDGWMSTTCRGVSRVGLTRPKHEPEPDKPYRVGSNQGIDIVGPLLMAPKGARNGETPFNLVYGSEVVVPIEISMETKRIKEFKVRKNKKRHREDLDILEERREITSIRKSYYKHKLEGYYNKHIRPSTFKPGGSSFKRAFDLEKMHGYRSSSKKEFNQAGDDLDTASYPFIFEATADLYASLEEFFLKKPKSLHKKPASSNSKPSSLRGPVS
nr:hypothetical protein [Tanacetum cinerariifolium]